MPSPAYLVVSHTEDRHAEAVVSALTELGERALRLDTNDFPELAQISLWTDQHAAPRSEIRLPGGTCLSLDQVAAALYRRPERPRFSAELAAHYYEFSRAESGALLDSVYNLLQGRWLNDPFVMRRARDKFLQLHQARLCGLTVPDTAFTNSVAAVQDLKASQQLIYKALRAASIEDPGSDTAEAVFTSLLTEPMMADLPRLKYAPGQFQPYIAKKHELRITVAGSDIIPCKIDSQTPGDSIIDFRAVVPDTIGHEIVDIPGNIKRSISELLDRLGLKFGCIDMIVTDSDEYVFLEINPNGQWLWIELLTGYPIAKSIVRAMQEVSAIASRR